MDPDRAFANRDFIPDADAYLPRWQEQARAFREGLLADGRARLNQPYGPHPREALDLFLPAGRPSGLVFFVHGGYWRAFDRSDWSHFAAGAVAKGWAVAMPSYPLAPQVRIGSITRSVHRALAHAAQIVPVGSIKLAGHSAGGHLVLRMISDDTQQPPAIAARIETVLAISPVTDLRPLIETRMNADFQLDPAEAAAQSPVLRHKVGDARVISWVGAEERPVFVEQARLLAEAWPQTDLCVAPGRHHFDVIDDLTDPDSPMLKALFDGS